jgi:hypothetical protein
MELYQLNHRHINAKLHQEKNAGIQSCPPKNTPSIARIFPNPQKMDPRHRPHSPLKTHEKGIKHVQQIVGSIFYYARAVNMTILMSFSSIAVQQTKGTTQTMGQRIGLLDYLTTNSDAKVQFHASDMVMHNHFDSSHLSKTMACS